MSQSEWSAWRTQAFTTQPSPPSDSIAAMTIFVVTAVACLVAGLVLGALVERARERAVLRERAEQVLAARAQAAGWRGVAQDADTALAALRQEIAAHRRQAFLASMVMDQGKLS